MRGKHGKMADSEIKRETLGSGRVSLRELRLAFPNGVGL